MMEDSTKKKKKKEGPAEARKRRKAIITSLRTGASVGPTNTTSGDTAGATTTMTTTTTTTKEPSMIETATAAALAEASTPLMEAAVLAAATAAVDDDTSTLDKTVADNIPSENPAEADESKVETDDAVETSKNTVQAELSETALEQAGDEKIGLAPGPLSKDNEPKSDGELPKSDVKLEAEDESDADEQSSDAGKRIIETVVTTKPNPHGNKKKTQITYEPSVPMSKDQLATWRREARRVRNRESAAASRQRIRSRITELEEEVTDWKEKYNTAMERLQELQQQHQAQGHVDVNNNNAETGTLA